MTSLRPLRPHQVRALDLLRSSISSGRRRPMVQAPTGAGKTVLAAHIVAGAAAKRKRIAFCVPSLSLIDQTFDRFRENGIDAGEMGIVQADHPWRRPSAPVQICSAQTLARRELPDVDVIVIDEAHVRYAIYDRWMAEQPGKLFVGLSATPWSKGLGKHYDDLVRPTSLRELIDLGLLSKFRVFAPSAPDLSGVSTRQTVNGLDYDERELEDACNRPKLVADVVETWLRRSAGLPTLCFAVGRLHARALHDRFTAEGVRAAYVDANTPREDRVAFGERLARRELDVVVNIGTLTTGVDWDVRALILARPTKSAQLFVQIIGRSLRTADGKTEAMILDHSDTHQRLGFVTDVEDRHDALDDGRKRKATGSERKERKDPLPKCCPSCTALMPVLSRSCPACGYEMPVHANVEEIDGQLEEFAGYRTPSRRSDEPSVKDQIRAMGKEAVYGQLKWVMADKRRKKGWVDHTYRDIFDVWPKGISEAAMSAPSPVLRSWLRHRDIAWAKSAKASGAEVRA